MPKILLFNKPYGILTQFTSHLGSLTLAYYIPITDVYAAGRLDKDSEGLLLLTDDGKLQHELTDPEHKIEKAYWVQVEGCLSSDALAQLRKGVQLKDGYTLPAKITKIAQPANLWARDRPIRERKAIPTEWLDFRIKEGRNRQIRRMTAAVGHPTLRLIRFQIGNWELGNLQPGEYRIIQH